MLTGIVRYFHQIILGNVGLRRNINYGLLIKFYPASNPTYEKIIIYDLIAMVRYGMIKLVAPNIRYRNRNTPDNIILFEII